MAVPDMPKISELFRIVNDGFDAMNSKIPIDKQNPLKCAYGMKLEQQNKAMDELRFLMESTKFFFTKPKNKKQPLQTGENVNGKKAPTVKKALLPCQKGFIISICSFKALRKLLKEKYSVQYLLGVRLNQDILECFFFHGQSIWSKHNSKSSTI